jgi:hypothetical protein
MCTGIHIEYNATMNIGNAENKLIPFVIQIVKILCGRKYPLYCIDV